MKEPRSEHLILELGRQLEGKAALRETALLYLPEEVGAHLRGLGDRLYYHYLEHSKHEAAYCGSHAKALLRAALDEARHLAYFLASTAQLICYSQRIPRPEKELGVFADKLALRLAEIADRIELKMRS